MNSTSLVKLLPLVGTALAMASGDVGFRLPASLAPTHYWLKLMPTFEEEDFLTSGELKISVRCDQATDEVVFNQNGINMTSVRLTTDSGQAVYISDRSSVDEKQMYRLKLNDRLEKGSTYFLEMNFSYPLNGQLEGFYKSSYTDDAGQKRWLATTQFSPINARRAFPCWDEPSFKAKFTITLGRAGNMTSLSNMERSHTTAMEGRDGWFWDHYQETLPVSTYLVAFIICDLPNRDVAGTKTPHFKVWARKEILKEMDHLADISPKVLAYVAEYFQIPFPLKKIDLFAVPDFGFSAMENWGLVTFAESAVKNSKVIAHELAHQWFRNLVTPQWWEDLWLKEGFATFIGIIALSHVDNSTEAVDKWIVAELHHSMFEDSLEASHPVSNPVDDPRMIWQAFDAISYEKGSAIIRMMCDFLGEESFRQGLNSYLRQYSYGNARRQQLWQVYDNITDIDVKDVMDGWTLQVGYPVLTVNRHYNDGTASITQERFLLNGEHDRNNTLWRVPMSYRSKQNLIQDSKDIIWLDEKGKTIKVDNLTKDDWLLVNLDQTGYYRVNYDSQNWNMLQQNFKELPRLSKSQLINDGFNLAIAGKLSYDVPLSMVEKLSDINDVLIWNVTITELNNIFYLLNKTPLLIPFKEYIISLLPLENVNNFEGANTTLMNFATFLDEKHMINMATEIVNKLIEKNETILSIPKELRKSVYCAAIRHGKEDIWDYILSRYLEENEPEEKQVLMLSLACSQDEGTLKKLLNALLTNDSGIRKQDAKFLFSAVAGNQAGADLALDFLCSKWDDIRQRYGLGYKIMSTMVLSLGKVLNQESQYKKLHDLYEKNKHDLGSTSNAFSYSLERIRINIHWQEINYKHIEEWIKKRKQK